MNKHKCSSCGVEFSDNEPRQSHECSTAKQFQCFICQKKLQTLNNLKTHMKTVHDDERPFSCMDCSERHIKCLHLQIDAAMQNVLEDVANSNATIAGNKTRKQRLNGAVTIPKKYKCDRCNFHTNHKLRFRDHIFTHTGERPHSCDICKKKFTQKSQLNSHRRNVHQCICRAQFPDEEARQLHKRSCTAVFECYECHEIQKNRGCLNAHMKTHRNGEPFSCADCYCHHKKCCCLKNKYIDFSD